MPPMAPLRAMISVTVIASATFRFLLFLFILLASLFIFLIFSMRGRRRVIRAFSVGSDHTIIERRCFVAFILFLSLSLTHSKHGVFHSHSKVFVSVLYTVVIRAVGGIGCLCCGFFRSGNYRFCCLEGTVDPLLLISVIKVSLYRPLSDKLFSQEIFFGLFGSVLLGQFRRCPLLVHPVNSSVLDRRFAGDFVEFLGLPFLLNLAGQLFGLGGFLFLFLLGNPYFLLVGLVFGVPAFFAEECESLNHLLIVMAMLTTAKESNEM
mmetsp:Transcript_14621/g.36767  ORF Transcript_14621/g.36767 Transcript_14621/m.36767 type:complete len:264 (-) Transcript_14621:57-848(-)